MWLVSTGRINVSLHTFLSAHRAVSTQFRLIGPYASMLPMPPYAVVHARRSDKDRASASGAKHSTIALIIDLTM